MFLKLRFLVPFLESPLARIQALVELGSIITIFCIVNDEHNPHYQSDLELQHLFFMKKIENNRASYRVQNEQYNARKYNSELRVALLV